MDRPAKRSKTSDPPPSYASQRYWDDRYANQFQIVQNPASVQQQQRPDDTLPFHSWYFTYPELRPLILPLIFGNTEETDEEDGVVSVDYDDTKKTAGDDSVDPSATITTTDDNDNDKEEISANSNPTNDTSLSEENNTASVANDPPDETTEESPATGQDNDEQEDFIEVVEEGDSDEEEEQVHRPGLAVDGPIRVIEIGCGDVPLGAALGLELLHLEQETGSKLLKVVESIRCTDYSPTVIAQMQKRYGQTKGEHSINIRHVPLEFQVADARRLPYPDASIDLILEKGTLDAMLSDTTTGGDDCRKILSECARVLKVPGFLVLVSHLNAHTLSGLSWMQEVVYRGLGSKAQFQIEVHGKAEIEMDEEGKVPVGTAGPAVYVIEKTAHDNPNQATIPVRLVEYEGDAGEAADEGD